MQSDSSVNRPTRRQVLASSLTGGVALLGGCTGGTDDPRTATKTTIECIAETYPYVQVETEVTDVGYDGTAWTVGAEVTAEFEFGHDDVGLHGVELAAFDAEQRYAEGGAVGDLSWSEVPSEDRVSFQYECQEGTGQDGTLTRAASFVTEEFPTWVTVRFQRDTIGATRFRGSHYTGPIPDRSPRTSDYDIESVPPCLTESVRQRRYARTEAERSTDTPDHQVCPVATETPSG